jgi:thiol-disulfide isomerase/thioredoxin
MQFVLLSMASVLLPACRDGSRSKLVAGDRFPDVALPYLDSRGAEFSIPSGVALLLNFWASWCEPCRREMPSLEKLSSFFSPGDLQVIGITVDNDLNLAREFSLQYKLTFPLLSDSGQALSSSILRIPAFPATYLLERGGIIAGIVVGERDWADNKVVEGIEELLAVRRLPGH